MLLRVPPREQDPPPLVGLGNRALRVVEDSIYVIIAALLAVAALVVLARAAYGLFEAVRDDVKVGVLDVLDSLLLVFILVELLFAVRATLAKREIVAEPFLLVGILAAIKEIVVLSVTAAEEYIGKGPEFARAMVEIGLLGVLVLLLSGSAVLLRKKEEAPEEGAGTEAAAG